MQVEQLDERLIRYAAPNGLRVLAEQLPGVRSMALGIWVRSGSAHEPVEQTGIAHLLEHLVFKGTEHRSAKAIAQELESRGGSLDAYTSRDHTNFQAHILDTDLPVAIDVLSDLVRRPRLEQADLELERNVVLEEINGVTDTPDDLVFELHNDALWQGHPYGRSILGSRESVLGLDASHLRAFHQACYHPANCVIAAAGSIDPEQLLELLEADGWFAPDDRRPRPEIPGGTSRRGLREVVARDTQQCHIVFGTDTIPANDPRRYAFGLVATVFGGGMSSRLFQRIREERGLAYAIFSYQHFYQAAGTSGVYVGTQPETADEATEAILAEYARLAAEGLPDDELAVAKQQLKGQVVLSLESPSSRMYRLASGELTRDRYRRIDEVLAEIDAVDSEAVREITAEYFAPERQSILRLGPQPVLALHRDEG